MTHELWVKHSKTEDFHEIPLGSFVIFVNQPQKNNVLSLFEKQVYPLRLLPNGEAEAPYDVAGWTLPLQMGVENYEIWDIRDLEKFRNTLKRCREYQSGSVRDLNLSRTLSRLRSAKSVKDESAHRTLQAVCVVDGRRLDAVRLRHFSDSVYRRVSDEDFRQNR